MLESVRASVLESERATCWTQGGLRVGISECQRAGHREG